MTKLKMYSKDIAIALSFTVFVFILYKQTYFNMVQLALGLLGMCVVTIILVSVSLMCKASNNTVQSKIHKFKLIFKVRSIVHKKYDTRMIDTVFAYFVHYYETNAKEIENDREFPEEDFPDGKFDLVKTYSYIEELRDHNQHILSKLDFIDDKVFLYGMHFNTFKYTLKNNQLVITGQSSEEGMTYLQYSIARTKIEKSLYDLDTEIASWIIKNRNHFGF